MPSEASGRYSPGPGTDTLLGDGIYQEIRPAVANCSPKEPDSLATESRKLPDLSRRSEEGSHPRRLLHAEGEAPGRRPGRGPFPRRARPRRRGHLAERRGGRLLAKG